MSATIIRCFANKRKDKIFLFLMILVVGLGGAFAFPLSYLTNSNELIGLCLIPFVVRIQGESRFNYFYLVLFILFGIGSWMYGVRMFYFFSLAFYIFWLIEMFFGVLNILTVFLLGFMSPFFYQISVILGFPIRLQLSQVAGKIVEWIGIHIQIEGNMILLDGAIFTVDEACMGLNMLAISMLMGVFILAHNSRIEKKTLKFTYILFFFAVGFALNILANLFRIVILVLFKIGPENLAHDVTGIICIIIYVLLPLYKLGHWMIFRYGTEQKVRAKKVSISLYGHFALVLVSLLMMSIGIYIDKKRTEQIITHTAMRSSGFTVTYLNDGMTKMVKDSFLIYVKPIPEFFSGEHSPLICWKGSGYAFKSFGKSKVSNKEIYYGKLVKKNETLFTAWWYDNGTVQTISQFDWRIRMMQGQDKFCLINVTSNDQFKLEQMIQSIFEKRMLQVNHNSLCKHVSKT